MKLLQGLSAPGMRKYSVSVHSIGTKNEKRRLEGGTLEEVGEERTGNRISPVSVLVTDTCTGKNLKCSRSRGLVILFVTMV